MYFCERLREMRQEKGLTQRKLAGLLNMSKNMICEYEKGRAEPNLETLIKLSKILDCSIDYLIGNSDYLGNIITKSDFSEEEKRLLSSFEQLPAEHQDFLVKTAETMLSWKNK